MSVSSVISNTIFAHKRPHIWCIAKLHIKQKQFDCNLKTLIQTKHFHTKETKHVFIEASWIHLNTMRGQSCINKRSRAKKSSIVGQRAVSVG